MTSFGFLLLGGFEALLIRIQLAVPRNTFLDPGSYDALFTVHGTTMIFLVVMPILLGFSNYIVPLQLGAHDMAFPRLNALSYWLFLFGGLVLYWGFLNGTPPDTGWFSYVTLAGPEYRGPTAVRRPLRVALSNPFARSPRRRRRRRANPIRRWRLDACLCLPWRRTWQLLLQGR